MPEQWISATSTYNYMMKDPLLDWLNYHYTSSNHKDSSKHTNTYNFTTYIMNQGIIFERKIVKFIIKKFGQDRFIEINGQDDPRNPAKFKQTIAAMKKGIPFIHSGVIHNKSNKTFGIPDLLVRSDWMCYLVNDDVECEDHPSPKLGVDWHYRVVDIKFTCLLLRSDGKHLLNSGSFPAYKAQLLIYNWGIGAIQGYTPDQVYILGRRWSYTTRGQIYTGDSCFDKLGIIDYGDQDSKYLELTQQALDWIREVRTKDAAKWNILDYPLDRWELYPNMCNSHDYPWHEVKKNIARRAKELTCLWMVGPKNRNIALDDGICQWNDPRCNSLALGIRGKKVSRILDKIIEINQQDKIKILPAIIKNNLYNWQSRDTIEFFVDFETCNGAVADIKGLPKAINYTIIFMIGVGYIEPKSGQWFYKDFTVDLLTFEEEKKICRKFMSFIQEKSNKYGIDNPRCIHWSKAEESMWGNSSERHKLDYEEWSWLDLLDVFKSEPIVINGCMSYGLKDVSKAMFKHGMIKSIWNDKGKCVDGQGAMIAAHKADRQARINNISMKDVPIMKEIVEYNKIDVKVLHEIITYLRLNHIRIKRKRNEGDEQPVKKKRRLA